MKISTRSLGAVSDVTVATWEYWITSGFYDWSPSACVNVSSQGQDNMMQRIGVKARDREQRMGELISMERDESSLYRACTNIMGNELERYSNSLLSSHLAFGVFFCVCADCGRERIQRMGRLFFGGRRALNVPLPRVNIRLLFVR